MFAKPSFMIKVNSMETEAEINIMGNLDRSFSTGSLDAPDPYDKYLDSIGYYRKHIARDASSLFRVVSEQIYESQHYHRDIREICVSYMALHRSAYEKLVTTDLDFDEYLKKMSKLQTSGTLSELHALAYRFKRNVLLFDAYSSGNWYISEPEFSECLLVFSASPKHFDSVYLKSDMESIAFCQSLVYEIIYSYVFKLPDVMYAVERMLHDVSGDTYITRISVSPYDNSQESLMLSDGRDFILDRAEETECILENYLLCHFHNPHFDQITMQVEQIPIELIDDSDAYNKSIKWFDCSLPNRNVSCVRQLLYENITPFSYKVAKSLDRYMYRNVDFDVWNDARRNNRFKKWRQCDQLQIGVKCLVDNLQPNQKFSYYGHIQEMCPLKRTCDVYIRSLGLCKTVPFSSITALPNKPWMIPSHHYEKKIMKYFDDIGEAVKGEPYKNQEKNEFYLYEENVYMEQTAHYLTKPFHIPQKYCEYIAYPQYNSNRTTKNDDTSKGNHSSSNKNVTNKKHEATAEVKPAKAVEVPKIECEPHRHAGTQMNVGSTSSAKNAGTQQNYSNFQSNAGNSGYGRRTDTDYNYQVNQIASMIKRKDLLPSMHQINVNVQESSDIKGRDLPYNDVRTLRFFYNLGIEFLRFLYQTFPAKTISTFFNPVESSVQRSRYHYYDEECAALAADFHRSAQISGKERYGYVKTSDVGQQHNRQYSGANTPAASKKYSRNHNYEYNRSQRQFAEDATKYTPNNNMTSAECPVTSSNSETSAWTPDAGMIPQYLQPPPPSAPLSAPALQYYPCYPNDNPDSTNMFTYGYYPPMNENMVTYQMLPSGMGLTESDEFELAQTYPYYSPPDTYYYPQPLQPMAMPPQQGCWYPQPVPVATAIATPIPTTSYGQYAVPGASDNHTNNNTNSVQFTPNEPSINTEVDHMIRWSERGT